MTLRSLGCVAALAALAFAPAAHAAPTPAARTISFRHVTVIDGLGGAPQPDRTVVVRSGRIASIAPSRHGDGTRGQVIEATGKFLIPGLIDTHVHLSGPLRERTGSLAERLRRADGVLASYLYLGFTTVADMGNDPRLVLEERRREQAGELLAPHLLIAGNLLTSPGGKSTDIGLAIAGMPEDQPVLERHLREQAPDIVKLVYDEQGWATQPLGTIWSQDTLGAIVAFYHRHHARTIVHIASELRAREAIAAGVDAFAHPVTTGRETDEFVQLMALRKIPFATTLAIRDNYARLADHPGFLERDDYRLGNTPAEEAALRSTVRDRYRASAMTGWSAAMLPVIMENIRRIVAAGGVAALGTDMQSGAAAHREMQLLVQAGIDPVQVIAIATHNAAVLLGRDERTGSIEVGRDADLVLLDRDPLADIENLEAIALVMKSGVIVDESRLPLPNGAPRPRGTGRPSDQR